MVPVEMGAVGAITVGIVAILRMVFNISEKLLPITGVLVGTITTFLVSVALSGGQFSAEAMLLLQGIITGLTANGLYDNTLGLVNKD